MTRFTLLTFSLLGSCSCSVLCSAFAMRSSRNLSVFPRGSICVRAHLDTADTWENRRITAGHDVRYAIR